MRRSPDATSTAVRSRAQEEVHDIFSPESAFNRQRGTWGLQGTIAIPDREGDFVFFVTFGTKQGHHTFDEGVSSDGVLTWQSQPSRTLGESQTQHLIHHDCDNNSIYLFLRTKSGRPYTYLGRLKYLNHDSEREQPVYFNWQILDWPISGAVHERVGLTLNGGEGGGTVDSFSEGLNDMVPAGGLLHEEAPPARSQANGGGVPTKQFQAKKSADYAKRDAANRQLGKAGELTRQVLNIFKRNILLEEIRNHGDAEAVRGKYIRQARIP